jgi:outer membrane usher protein
MTGSASAVDRPGKRVSIFTNASGKFGAEGLAPGRWIIEMATDGSPLKFALDVPKGVDGLYKAGTLRPSGSNPP